MRQGTVAGIVGAGGNAGAVIFSILFRQLIDYRTAFFWMGASTSAVSLLSCLIWIRGYEGLFFSRRLFTQEKNRDPSTLGGNEAVEQLQNNMPRSLVTDPLHSIGS